MAGSENVLKEPLCKGEVLLSGALGPMVPVRGTRLIWKLINSTQSILIFFRKGPVREAKNNRDIQPCLVFSV